jgi:hypothetical protein
MTKHRDRRRSALTFILMLAGIGIAVRLLLVGNPWIWRFYAAKLRPADIGWRQYSAVRKKRDSFLPPPGKTPYLAVGSSQTGAIFLPYADRHPDLRMFTAAAMSPFDFVTHAQQIFRLGADTLLLYLSDFDLARQPERAALVLAPAQGLGIIALWRDLARAGGLGDYSSVMVELTVGELFSEFKYRFVFRGIAEKAFIRLAERLGPLHEAPATRSSIEERIALLRSSISREGIPFNMYFLERFLEQAVAAGRSVIVLEGQYSPIVSSPETRRIAEDVSGRMATLSHRLEGVRFVPRSEFRSFSESDYYDLTHVVPEAGYAYATALLELLRSHPAIPSAGSSDGSD